MKSFLWSFSSPPIQEGLLLVTSERRSAVVECMSWGQGVVGSSLTNIIVLSP